MTNPALYSDQTIEPRKGEAPDPEKLGAYLHAYLPDFSDILRIRQFPGGYSNLTFLLDLGDREIILRKPPAGANIRSAHDMGREFRVLTCLKPVYPAVPKPLLFCEDPTIIGTPFYLMEKVSGVILRNKLPEGLDITAATMRSISESAIDNLAKLHLIDADAAGLSNLGKPQGYVFRQVEGWINRYRNAQTDKIDGMDITADWMMNNLPAEQKHAFIHNDYKYDNLVLDPVHLSEIKAVLDWEMATVGDPLMDLGTTLAYWAEATDHPALKPFNLTWLPGNLTRREVVERYAAAMNIRPPDMLFYYVFGSFKIGGIVQQIYARYKKGFTSDERFAGLIHVLKACAANALRAINSGRISNL
jgi:aminoglycoside phosphotransferase (APT) family kinase protein